eukprot:CAMPEP_0197665824 /NCGR_PEP_ID=MMETSP1338-20131121/60638_1 /TAXON_ID=43686 ORGANISM="Pelagodinium beii, Strain RCC1491" /NCGR_SAMPLE_ID=MMETSP1338 /ASSEMBLY_ACC=CAM_ASM_000754 /LENGTH=52 /DNA_ID=CAMNT_0043244743 /DNA_START=423 /DNA_END=581 /DNA_ORIENTATION=+
MARTLAWGSCALAEGLLQNRSFCEGRQRQQVLVPMRQQLALGEGVQSHHGER